MAKSRLAPWWVKGTWPQSTTFSIRVAQSSASVSEASYSQQSRGQPRQPGKAKEALHASTGGQLEQGAGVTRCTTAQSSAALSDGGLSGSAGRWAHKGCRATCRGGSAAGAGHRQPQGQGTVSRRAARHQLEAVQARESQRQRSRRALAAASGRSPKRSGGEAEAWSPLGARLAPAVR
jgi:hypothetical protein